jgi:preprotein translocase subunit Sec61beta
LTEKKTSQLETITGLVTLALGAIAVLAPLLLLKVTPQGVVYSPICSSGQTSFCLTSTDLSIGGFGLVFVGVILLFLGGGRRRRAAADPRLIVALSLLILAGVTLILHPIAVGEAKTCVGFWVFQACVTGGFLTIAGIQFDPNFILALSFAVMGTVVAVFGSAKFGKAQLATR